MRPFDATPDLYAEKVSGGKWKRYPHIVHALDAVFLAICEGNGQVIVNMPARHGKSEGLSYWLPMWYLDQYPHHRVILSGYQKEIAEQAGRKIRNEMATNPLVRVKLSEDSRAAGRFHTAHGGGLYCAGVDTALTGRGGNLIIADDLYKNWEEANSSEQRARVEEFFWSTLWTRREPGATVVVPMVRWHPEDICGLLERQGGWTVLSYPAVAEERDILGREPGEPLCPERYDTPALEEIKAKIGHRRWFSMYQQRPMGDQAGKLYSRFSARNIDPTAALDPILPLHLKFDFNIQPGMHVLIGQYRENEGQFVTTDEIHADALDLNGAMTLFEAWWREKQRAGVVFPEVHIFGDATGQSRNIVTSKSCYDTIAAKLALMRVPHRLRIPRAQPPVLDSIDALNDALCGVDEKVRYRVHPRCVRLVTDYRELNRAPDGLIDKRNQKLSHASDCERYWVHYLRPAGRGEVRERPRGRISISSSPAA